jgi:hypothetical protein
VWVVGGVSVVGHGTVAVRRSGRGGNRLAPHRYPVCGPRYVRVKSFGPDPERRDRHQRTRARRAVSLALRRGQLSPVLAAVLLQLFEQCSDRLLEAAPGGEAGCSGWWSLGYIHDLVLQSADPDIINDWAAGGDVAGSGEAADVSEGAVGGVRRAGGRTAGRWMAALGELGWVEVVHRYKVVNGVLRGTSNLWRFCIPAGLRDELQGAEDAARARNADRRSKTRPPGRYTAPSRPAGTVPPGDGLSEVERRVTAPCPSCDGAGELREPGTGASYRCGACRGRGYAAGP